MQLLPSSISWIFNLPELKLSPLNPNSPSPHLPLVPGIYQCIFWLYEFDYSRHLIKWNQVVFVCIYWTVVLEKTLESPLDWEIQSVHPKGDQSWVFIGRTDAEAETLILWPAHAKSWLIGKDPDAGRDWEQEEKGTTEDEMAGWHHWLDGHEFE